MTLREKVQEILARAEKAKPGPWEIQEDTARGKEEFYGFWHAVGPYEVCGKTRTDTDSFVAASREDVPWLCKKLLIAENGLQQIYSETQDHPAGLLAEDVLAALGALAPAEPK